MRLVDQQLAVGCHMKMMNLIDVFLIMMIMKKIINVIFNENDDYDANNQMF